MTGSGGERHKRLLAFSVLVVCVVAYCNGEKTECYVDEEGDKADPNNIYKCAKDHTCCREEGLPSCCQKKDSDDAIWEQVTLWGILIGGILILALVMWCCRHDGDCCCNAKDGRKSCCGKPYGKRPEDNFADGYGIPSDTDEYTDSDDDDDFDDKKPPPKKQQAKEAPKQSPEKKKPPPEDEKKPTPPADDKKNPSPPADDKKDQSPPEDEKKSPPEDEKKSPREDEKKPPQSPKRSAPSSPQKDTPDSPMREQPPSPAKKHLPSPERMPSRPSSGNPPDMSQMKLDEIP